MIPALRRASAALILVAIALPSLADDLQACTAAAGQLVEGTVVSAPRFQHGSFLKGIELSHTHFTLKDAGGTSYDVAVDNVFATGYTKGSKKIPSGLSGIANGDRMQACGEPFPGGIHFVHTNCGDPPVATDPNGWLKRVMPDGSTGPNLEGSTQFCYLWPRK